MDNLIKATKDDDLIIKDSLQEQSYDISPYRGSDDEDEDEDDLPNNKLIPSWARFVTVHVFGAYYFITPFFNLMSVGV